MQASHGARIDEQTSGVYVIAATPFADDGELDLASLDSLTDFYLDKDVAGLTILGMMGEASKLTEAETATVMTRILKRVDGRVPVVVGVSHPSNRHLERLARQAMELGAAGVMVAPAAGRHTDDQVYGYYATVAERLGADIPICLQDFPQSAGVHTSVAVIHRLVDDFPQVVMLKHEDFPGMRKLSQVRARSEAEGRRRISILVGNGGLFLPQEMLRGADGAMTGFAYPEMLVQVCRLFAAGKAEAAEDLFTLPAAAAARVPVRHRPGPAQGDAAPARRHPQRLRAPAGAGAGRGRPRRAGPADRAPGSATGTGRLAVKIQ